MRQVADEAAIWDWEDAGFAYDADDVTWPRTMRKVTVERERCDMGITDLADTGLASSLPTLTFDADLPPLRIDVGGVVRVGNGRISLDLLVEQYENGMSPEDMVRAYDTLSLADVYAVIAYYLRHRDEVRAYLARRKQEAKLLQEEIVSERPRVSREELMTRLAAKEKESAPAGQ